MAICVTSTARTWRSGSRSMPLLVRQNPKCAESVRRGEKSEKGISANGVLEMHKHLLQVDRGFDIHSNQYNPPRAETSATPGVGPVTPKSADATSAIRMS